MQVLEIPRTFKFNDMELEDINPNLSLEQVRAHYSGIYPELTNATIENKGLNAERSQCFEFKTLVGTKG